MASRVRLERLLVDRGLVESREKAARLILAGDVMVDGQRVDKAGSLIPTDADLDLRGRSPYVSRGGEKLVHALQHFTVTTKGRVCIDVGSSTGGFTDCLLQLGARRVYAVDVGHGQLHQRLRQDPRVSVMEKINARHPFALPEKVDLITVDVSFISLTLVLPPAIQHLTAGEYVAALVKPQFEAEKGEVGRGGVIRDPRIHARVLGRVVTWAVDQGLRVRNLCPSPILGDAGNREFFILLQKPEKKLNFLWS